MWQMVNAFHFLVYILLLALTLVLFFISQMEILMSEVIEANASKNRKNGAVKYIVLKYARNTYF